MAIRQRIRSPRKAPPLPVRPQTDDDDDLTAADVPGIDQTTASTAWNDSSQDANGSADAAGVRFVGEQIVYKSRDERIAESAYLCAEARGFAAGYELEDWLKAEKEVDALLSGSNATAD